MKRATAVAVVLLVTGAMAASGQGPKLNKTVQKAEAAISPDLLRAHTEFLADDLLEGRGPGARGSELAAKYIAAQFARLGLEPGPKGSYFQNVPMLGKKVEPTVELRVGRESFTFFDDFVSFTDAEEEQVGVEGQLVFVGYGIIAPEYRWDDFKGADVKGKILLMLVNDPPASAEEPELFGGKALTYYGRWTYKFESAARQGAAGAILIHTTASAGYPFKVVQSSWSGERFELPQQPGDLPALKLKAWVSEDAARKILAQTGLDLDALRKVAASREFKPLPLGLNVQAKMEQKLRRLESPNVVGVLPGSDAKLRSEYVIYTAHFDHLGVGKPVNGDAIYNGAADNAVGVAGLLAIAEAMARASQEGAGAKRSQVFLAVTAEEYGLLGSLYYARNPLFPPAQTVANINMDGLNLIGPTNDMVQVGSGKSELDEVAQAAAREMALQLKPDQFPEQGFFYRSDQFSFAQIGIPALYFDNGLEVIGKPADYGRQKVEEYIARDYHQPSDEIRPDWDWSGAEQMARYLFRCGWKAANWERAFDWHPTAEFRAAREESLRQSEKESAR